MNEKDERLSGPHQNDSGLWVTEQVAPRRPVGFTAATLGRPLSVDGRRVVVPDRKART